MTYETPDHTSLSTLLTTTRKCTMEQHASETTFASPFHFLHMVERLKQIPRRGWEIRGIPSPETISAHMYRMIIMIMMEPEVCIPLLSSVSYTEICKIDENTRAHAIKMAAVHDLAEAVVGDIAPSDGVSKGMLAAQLYII
jgi:hypothetical protein